MAIIDGKKISEDIIKGLKFKDKPNKILAAILVGDDPASINFLKQKEKVAKELGVDFRLYKFPENITNDQLRNEAGKIALLKRVGGVIIQLPLPSQLNRQYILNVIPREKDVDVLGERALGAFYAGRNPVLPPAVGAVEEILSNINLPAGGQLSNIKVAVIGLGFLVGKPIANWLMGKCPEIYLLDEGSDFKILKQADLIITGVGKSGLIEPAILKEGATVIDFGYPADLDTHSPLISRLSFYTLTPGGTGPIVVAKLFENFYKLCAI